MKYTFLSLSLVFICQTGHNVNNLTNHYTMRLIIADAGLHVAMRPLTWTKPVAEILTGIVSTKRRWELILDKKADVLTEDYLHNKWAINPSEYNILINAGLLPNSEIVNAIANLEKGSIVKNGKCLATIAHKDNLATAIDCPAEPIMEFDGDVLMNQNTWDIFSNVGEMIKFDFELITNGRKSQPLSNTNIVIGDNPIFLEEGAVVEAAVLNTKSGPIYIGKDAEVMESSNIRGPFAMSDHSVVKMGAKIYGPTVLGEHSKVGGELNNVVFASYSNKAHDGFLGNAVIGEWCNLGADTNNSNLKNNYAQVRLWDYATKRFAKTGLQFCGLIMGDHSKCGINTMLNTGTVIGVSCNIFGAGFPRNFVPSFAWGGSGGYTVYATKKAYEVAEIVMSRRNLSLTDSDKEILQYVFENTEEYRNFH